MSQWRAYSGREQGFSLGFDTEALKNGLSAETNIGYSVRQCEYDEENQNADIENLASTHLRDFLDKWKIYCAERRDPSLSFAENLENNWNYIGKPILDMYTKFITFGAFLKHRGFSEEKEWRFAFATKRKEDCSFREGRFGLTPYLPIGLKLCVCPSPLRRVVVGPGPHKREWVETVKLLLAKKGFAVKEVVPSQIPYRN